MQTLFRIVAALVPVTLLFVIAEGATRVLTQEDRIPYPAARSEYLPFTTPRDIAFRQELGELRATLHFDAEGFRTSANAGPSPGPRALYLGDSFTLGWGLSWEESYVGLLQSRLGEARSILDAGYTAGYSPDAYYAYLVRNAERLAIDEVLIFVYDGNDIDGDIASNVWLETDRHGAPTRLETTRRYRNYLGRPLNPARWTGVEVMPLVRHSWFVRKLANRVRALTPGTAPNSQHGREGEGFEEAWKRFETVTRATVELCREKGWRLGYVLIPPRVDLRQSYWEELHERVRALLIGHEVTVIDLVPHIDRQHYIPLDAHFNAAGARVAAERVWLEWYGEARPDRGADPVGLLPEGAGRVGRREASQ